MLNLLSIIERQDAASKDADVATLGEVRKSKELRQCNAATMRLGSAFGSLSGDSLDTGQA
jgi:hypothetical protein